MIREFEDEDAAAVAALRRKIDPFAPVSEESIIYGLRQHPAQAKKRAWVAEGGYANAERLWQAKTPGLGALWIGVDPERRRHGVGTALLRVALHHLRAVGVEKVQCWCKPEVVGFLERRGWQPIRERVASVVALRALPPIEPPEGIALASLREVDPRLVYDLDTAGSADEPGETFEHPSFEDYRRAELERPLLDHDASVVALTEGKAVALSMFFRSGPIGQNGFTCTHPDWRGGGLAKLVKSASLQRAFADGVERVSTMNDAENPAMLHINEWLGYRPIARETQFVLSGDALAASATR